VPELRTVRANQQADRDFLLNQRRQPRNQCRLVQERDETHKGIEHFRIFSRAAVRFLPPFRPCCVRNKRRAAMARLVAVYKKPADVEAFEKHYFGTHIPLAKTMPGFRKYEVSHGPVSVLAGPTDVYLIGTVYFDDLEAMNNAFASPEGRATAADRQLYAPDDTGVQIFTFDTREV
jgi:uncharacterized protein (TIGR02118 family)